MCDAITRNGWLFGNKVARNFGSQFDVSCQTTHRLLPVTVNLELFSAGINQLHALPLKLEWNINVSKAFSVRRNAQIDEVVGARITFILSRFRNEIARGVTGICCL